MYVCLPSNVEKSGHENHQPKNHQTATEEHSRHLTSREASTRKLDVSDTNHQQTAPTSSLISENLPSTNSSFLERLLIFHNNHRSDNKTVAQKEPTEVGPSSTDDESRRAFFKIPDTTSIPVTTTPMATEDDSDTNKFYFSNTLGADESSTLPSTISHPHEDLIPIATALSLNNISLGASTERPKPQDDLEQNTIDRFGNLFPTSRALTNAELPPVRLENDIRASQYPSIDHLQSKQDESKSADHINSGDSFGILQNLRGQLSQPQTSIELLQALRKLSLYENLSKFARQLQPSIFGTNNGASNSQPQTSNLLPVIAQEPPNDLAASDSAPSDSSMLGQESTKNSLVESTSINRDSSDSTRPQKPTRISLISPYSANFDHGFPPLRNSYLSRASQPQLLPETFVSNSVKLKNGKIDRPKKSSDNGDDVSIKKHRSSNTKPVAFFTAPDSGVVKPTKLLTTKRPIMKFNKDHQVDSSINDLTGNDSKNSNRDDRHANESTLKKVIEESQPPSKTPEESTTAQPHIDDVKDNELRDSMNNMFNPLTQPLSRLWGLSDFATKNDGYLNDPYKKSLYYTNSHLPDSNGLPYKPFTIKDLARQHGVPFRLRSPFDDRYNLASSSNIELKTALDTRLEDYHIAKPEQELHNPFDGPKIDDDLRQKSALKAIEAITQEPDFLMRLQESLYGHGSQLSPENINHLQRLYYHLLKPELNFPSRVSSMASSNNVNKVIPGPINPLDFSMSYASASESSTQPIGASARKPVNLVVTDLADKWALTQMPDLIPIPLAATVPGYLIRLPDGKILAAALTNSFTIQGIQNEPLNSGYKSFLNTKFKSLIKPTPTKNTINHVASDSIQKQVVLPLNSPIRVNQPVRNKNPTSEMGLLRGVFSHLGFGKSPSQRNNSTKDNGGLRVNQSKIIKISNSPFPVPSFSEQELAALPVADMDEPVFSFADESQIADNYYDTSAMRLPQFPYQRYSSPNFGSSIPEIGDTTDMATGGSSLSMHHKAIDQLANLRSLLHGNLFINGERRGSPGVRKFESPLLWLIYKAAKKLSHSSACNSVTGVTIAGQH